MKHLNLLVLRCRDIEASRRFYEVLDLRFEAHAHGDGPRHYACVDERGVLELYPATVPATGDRTGVGFELPDFEAVLARFAAAGFQPQPVRLNPWGRTFVVRDPDDRRVEIKETTQPEQENP
jgi:catechol 2,3-dioxygenase-like lactoylglutathione lyase family enzyme